MSVLAAIDFEALLELLWVAPLAAIAVAIAFALCVHGAAKASEERRDGHAVAATAYGGLALLGGLVATAVVVFGVAIIIAG